MQPKVSIVIPCYNKAKYISAMFDSIIAQKWDNIELVLVNDGSTDGTREIITKYETKFLARGYDVVIIDQENRGVHAAVYAGLKNISGDFVCQVDADDELDTEYVVTLANWLDEHPDYDWVVCDFLRVHENDSYSTFFRTSFPEDFILSNLVESYLLCQIRNTVPAYMVRTDYMELSRLIEYFYYDENDKPGTQEPQFILPLALAGGKLKHIPKPLYRQFKNETSISARRTYEEAIKHTKNLYKIKKHTTRRLNIDQHHKSRLLTFSEIAEYKTILSFADEFEVDDSSHRNALAKRLLIFLKTTYPLIPDLTEELLCDYQLFFHAVVDNVFNIPVLELCVPKGRIIAWGALGRQAKTILPYLLGTDLEPTELWDARGDGVHIKKVDVRSLTDSDLVIVLPAQELANEIYAQLAESKCATLSYGELWTYICSERLPDFYNGNIRF